MSLTAFVLVFISVFLHVAWNMLSKSGRPSMAFYALMSATASCLWLPFMLKSGLSPLTMPAHVVWLLLGSVVFEVVYMLGLARAYKRGDISFVYPVVRALPVLMIAGITTLFGIDAKIGLPAFCGMMLISAGCVAMPLASFKELKLYNYINYTTIFILLGAAGTTGYTLFDRAAMKILGSMPDGTGPLTAIGYLFWIEFGLTLGELLFVVFEREERKEFGRLFFRSFRPVVAGLCSSTAYGLILLAMHYVDNVSYIQAFRQISLPLGFFAGVLILKERATLPKTIGVGLIVAGLLLVAL